MSDPVTPTPVPPSIPAPDPAPASAAAPGRKLRWITPTLAIVATLAIGIAGGVLIGRSGASANQGNFARQFASGQGTGTGQQGGDFAGGGFTSGTIVSIDGTTITVKDSDGTQKTITTSGSTKVTKTSTSSVGALKKGETVTVIGETDADGKVAATTISEGDAGLRGGLGRPGGAGGTATPPATDSGD
jgi:Domain of unknown function (DUF5666)